MAIKDDTIRDMLRRRYIIKKLDKYLEPGNYGNVVRSSRLPRAALTTFLILETGFRKDIRDIIPKTHLKQTKDLSDKQKLRYEKRKREITNSINNCEKGEYIDFRGANLKFITSDGYEFLRPLTFIGACLKKHSHIATFFYGVGGTGIVMAILKYIF